MDQLAEYRARQRERFAEEQRRRSQEPTASARALSQPTPAAAASAVARTPERGSGLRSLEADVIKEINAARRSPSTYAAVMRERMRHGLKNEADAEAYREAIEFLERHPPLDALRHENVRMLRLAAEDHLVDLALHGEVGHAGSDGSSSVHRVARYGRCFGASAQSLWFGDVGARAAEIAQDLIVNEVNPSRSHRLCVFDASLRQIGVAHGLHKKRGACAVLVFAEGCLEDSTKSALRELSGPQGAASWNRSYRSGGAGSDEEYEGQQAPHGEEEQRPGETQISAPGPRAQPPQSGRVSPARALEMCGSCARAFRDDEAGLVEAFGARWHRSCFECSGCQASPMHKPFAQVDGKPRCPHCHCVGAGGTATLRPPLPAQPGATSSPAGRPRRTGSAWRAVSAARACRNTGVAPGAAWPGHDQICAATGGGADCGSPSLEEHPPQHQRRQRSNSSRSRCGTSPSQSRGLRRACSNGRIESERRRLVTP